MSCWCIDGPSKENLHLIIKFNKLFSFFSSQCFLREIENMFSVFLLSDRNTCESLGELKKLWKHSPAACVPTAFLVLPNFHSCFYPFRKACEGDKNCGRVQRISSRRGWGKGRNRRFHSSPPPPPCRSPPLHFSVFCHPRCTHPSLARSVSPHKEKETAAIQAITCYSSPLNLHQFLLV